MSEIPEVSGCHLCGRRRVDPGAGPSLWRRGVVGGDRAVMVLVCDECQIAGDWDAGLDRCAGCDSTALVRKLGETTCRSCGRMGTGSPGINAGTTAATGREELAADVAGALDRLLGPTHT